LGGLASLPSCSLRHDFSAALAAVDGFHERLGAGHVDQIFADASPEFQKSMNAEASDAMFGRIRRKLGRPRASHATALQQNNTPAGTFIVAQYQTQFDSGVAQETFTWRILDGRPRLAGYTVSSPLLLRD